MNTNLIQTIDAFAVFVGLVGVLVIVAGVVHGLIHFIALEMGMKGRYISHDSIRYRLGVYILLGLEFLVAADILETVFKPTLEQLTILGGIVVIRTGLNYFLNKELEDLKEDIK
jgi:uncharacterized membrane protein